MNTDRHEMLRLKFEQKPMILTKLNQIKPLFYDSETHEQGRCER